jgi:tetratricopeptide (TPR) repeat protein
MKDFILSFLLVITCSFCQGQTPDIDRWKHELLTADEDTNKVILLDSLSGGYTFSSADTAIMYAQQGLQLARKLNFKREEAYCLIDLGQALTTMGNYTGALDLIYQSIPIVVEAKDTIGIINAYSALGLCYRDQGDFKKAISYLSECLKLAELSQSKFWPVSAVLDVMSSVYERNNQLDSALYCANAAYPTNKNHSGLLYELGAIHSKLGHDSLALNFYRQAIPYAVENNAQIDIIDSYTGISQIYWRQGKSDSAIHYAKLALSRKWGKTYPIGMFRASNMLASFYESQKKTDSAFKYLRLTTALKDSLFNQQKTREASAYAFNEQLHQQELRQQLAQSELKYRNRLDNFALLAGLLIMAVVSVGLWRRNVFKQRSFALLQKQKKETDSQKTKAEKTLEELRLTQSQLIQQEKMASLGELTAGIAHEIQNPLNFVNNFSEVNAELATELKEQIQKENFHEVKRIADEIENNKQKIIHHGRWADSIVKNSSAFKKQQRKKNLPISMPWQTNTCDSPTMVSAPKTNP